MKNRVRQYLKYFLIIFSVQTVNAATNGNAELYNRQISELLKKGDCTGAKNVARTAESQDNSLSYLPEWYYQIIQCNKGDTEGFGVYIKEYFDRQIDKLSKNKLCKEADEYLNKIDKKFHTTWGYPSWLYRVARCYEVTDRKKSLVLYQRLITDFPKSDVAIEAKFRQNWLTGDRSWIFSKSTVVIEGVKKALRDKDVKALERYASKSKFYVGFEEGASHSLFDNETKHFLETAFKNSTPVVGLLNAPRDRYYTLLVVYPAEEYPFWFFTFEVSDGGWQWTGIMISGQSQQKK